MPTTELIDFYDTHPITDISFSYHNQHISTITHNLTDGKAIQLEANGDCPSLCWFELKSDMSSSCRGKVLIAIAETSNSEGSTEANLIFKDGSDYQLVMHNDSDGFYSSCLTITCTPTV